MPIAIKMAGKEIASYDTTTDKVAIKLSDDVSINDSAGNVVLNESGGVVTLNNGTIGSGVVFPALPADKGASLQLILTQNFSSVSSVSFEDVFSSSFRNYKLIGEVSGLSGDLRFRFFTSGTTEFTTSVYSYAGYGTDDNGNPRSSSASDQSYWKLDNTTADQVCFDFTIYKPFLTEDTFFSGTNLTERTAGLLYSALVQGGSVDSATSFAGCNIYPDAGTMSGNISIYGIKE